MVTEGNQQNPDTIGDTYSPTVNPMSVMVQLNLAAENKDTSIGAYDVISGFLNTPVRPGRRIFVKVRSDVATFWIQRYPEMKKYLHTDGCLYFELTKFLYGLAGFLYTPFTLHAVFGLWSLDWEMFWRYGPYA